MHKLCEIKNHHINIKGFLTKEKSYYWVVVMAGKLDPHSKKAWARDMIF
jgi:hypothetical protein